jgi:hypothetical protein
LRSANTLIVAGAEDGDLLAARHRHGARAAYRDGGQRADIDPVSGMHQFTPQRWRGSKRAKLAPMGMLLALGAGGALQPRDRPG